MFVPQSLNRYSYVLNNPINYVDPSGHMPWLAYAAAIVLGPPAVIAIGVTAAVTYGISYALSDDEGRRALRDQVTGFMNDVRDAPENFEREFKSDWRGFKYHFGEWWDDRMSALRGTFGGSSDTSLDVSLAVDTNRGFWRGPDYFAMNINVAIPNPFTATFVGWSGTATLDRYGDWFWSPLGVGVGKSATFLSGSFTANWLDQVGKPSQQQLQGSFRSWVQRYGRNLGWTLAVLDPRRRICHRVRFRIATDRRLVQLLVPWR